MPLSHLARGSRTNARAAALLRRGVVVNDSPARRRVAHDEREQALGLLAVAHLQVPATAHEGRVLAQHLDRKFAEVELAHGATLALVALLVALERGLPAARRRAAGEEGQVRRVPVTAHVAG